jgi:hypothetical protein
MEETILFRHSFPPFLKGASRGIFQFIPCEGIARGNLIIVIAALHLNTRKVIMALFLDEESGNHDYPQKNIDILSRVVFSLGQFFSTAFQSSMAFSFKLNMHIKLAWGTWK